MDPKPKAAFSGKSVFIGKLLLIKKTAFGKNIHEFGDFVFELFHLSHNFKDDNTNHQIAIKIQTQLTNSNFSFPLREQGRFGPEFQKVLLTLFDGSSLFGEGGT